MGGVWAKKGVLCNAFRQLGKQQKQQITWFSFPDNCQRESESDHLLGSTSLRKWNLFAFVFISLFHYSINDLSFVNDYWMYPSAPPFPQLPSYIWFGHRALRFIAAMFVSLTALPLQPMLQRILTLMFLKHLFCHFSSCSKSFRVSLVILVILKHVLPSISTCQRS